MSQVRPETIRAYDGTEVEVEIVKQLAGGGARVDVTATDGPRWRLDVNRTGTPEVVTTWNADGDLADVDLPEWMDDVIARLQRV
jgi:hypothetical protein